jgi:hypothetical protein
MPTVRIIAVFAGKTILIDLMTGRHLDGVQHFGSETEIADLIRPYMQKYLEAYPATAIATKEKGNGEDASTAT